MRLHRYVPFEDRFWLQVNKTDYCWEWVGLKDKDGYGRIHKDGKQTRTHVASWEMHYGPIPKGLWVLHRCDVPACIRPDHLFLGTGKDNSADRDAKGRGATGDRNASRLYPERRPRGLRHHWQVKPETRMHGDKNGRAKLTRRDVVEIKRLWAEGRITKVSLGKLFGVTDCTIRDVIVGNSWKNVG